MATGQMVGLGNEKILYRYTGTRRIPRYSTDRVHKCVTRLWLSVHGTDLRRILLACNSFVISRRPVIFLCSTCPIFLMSSLNPRAWL